MMVFPDYCVTMARYNAWQNKQLRMAFDGLSDAELRKNRKAFFKSLLGTANHLLWGDQDLAVAVRGVRASGRRDRRKRRSSAHRGGLGRGAVSC